MMYRDKDKQKQAQRERQRRHRQGEGVTKGVTVEGVTYKGVTRATNPNTQSIWDRHAAQRRPTTYPHQFNDRIGLALPGEPDYVGVCYKDEAGAWTVEASA